jgi:membrane-associated phospholipid phosphatase
MATPIFRQRLSACLFTAFAVGYAGYLLVPAVGPASAYPNLFTSPLPRGELGRILMEIVADGSSRYDTFPSLHVLITCMLLAHDWEAFRRRFWIMLGPSVGLFLSTIYLRYHYGVDLLAGLLLFLGLWGLWRWRCVLKTRGREK